MASHTKIYHTSFYVSQKTINCITILSHDVHFCHRCHITLSIKVLLPHQVCHDHPHRHVTCDRPAAWFGPIRIIFWEITPFLPCDICYTMAITTEHREDGNTGNVSCFSLWFIPPQFTYIFASWNIFSASFMGPPVWSSISLDGNFHPLSNASQK
jgi:hypothetical protein